jgi:DNA replication protein DnaC
VAISTNLVFSDWNRIFKDPMTTLAAIDRVVHHSVILDLMGMDSYRAREATRERTSPPPDPTQPPTAVAGGQAA